jgi:hypothetical protein
MKKVMAAILLVAFCLVMVGCYTIEHQIGKGSQTGVSMEKKQWFILWGLVPLSDVNTNQMSGGATDYTIKTEQSVVDVVIGIFTSCVTVYPRTVTVTK